MKRLWCLVGILTCFTLSCSSSGGSGSGGGGNIIGSSPTYKKEDLAGSWSYSARRQGGPTNCSGTMTFDRDLHLTGISNSCCPGGQLNRSEFWFWDYGFVKAYNYGWCTDPDMLMKYAMNFQGSDKRTIVGLLDVHESVGDNYTRFDITLTSQAPVVPPPVDPGTTSGSQVKKPVKAAGLSTVPPKK